MKIVGGKGLVKGLKTIPALETFEKTKDALGTLQLVILIYNFSLLLLQSLKVCQTKTQKRQLTTERFQKNMLELFRNKQPMSIQNLFTPKKKQRSKSRWYSSNVLVYKSTVHVYIFIFIYISYIIYTKYYLTISIIL